jgi:hypothetical protein
MKTSLHGECKKLNLIFFYLLMMMTIVVMKQAKKTKAVNTPSAIIPPEIDIKNK